MNAEKVTELSQVPRMSLKRTQIGESRCYMNIEMSLLFGAIGALLGVIGVIVTMKKDSKNQGAVEASISSKVDYIARGVDDI
ncbi:hypothetical protein [Lysinibacillus sp. NPDC056232]|uniref:hypothetical protein n=1 Tax=Lysinibacillus sp. NPDC056232 TaxID=3345756 RepID=UPI0035D88651